MINSRVLLYTSRHFHGLHRWSWAWLYWDSTNPCQIMNYCMDILIHVHISLYVTIQLIPRDNINWKPYILMGWISWWFINYEALNILEAIMLAIMCLVLTSDHLFVSLYRYWVAMSWGFHTQRQSNQFPMRTKQWACLSCRQFYQ